MYKRFFPTIFFVSFFFIFAGCAGTRQIVPLPDQSRSTENTEMARIYVIRPATLGTAISMNIKDGEQVIGNTGPDGYLFWERPAGETTVSCKSAENTSSLPLNVEKAKTYYILQRLQVGITFRCKLELVDETQGRQYLQQCHPPEVAPRL